MEALDERPDGLVLVKLDLDEGLEVDEFAEVDDFALAFFDHAEVGEFGDEGLGDELVLADFLFVDGEEAGFIAAGGAGEGHGVDTAIEVAEEDFGGGAEEAFVLPDPAVGAQAVGGVPEAGKESFGGTGGGLSGGGDDGDGFFDGAAVDGGGDLTEDPGKGIGFGLGPGDQEGIGFLGGEGFDVVGDVPGGGVSEGEIIAIKSHPGERWLGLAGKGTVSDEDVAFFGSEYRPIHGGLILPHRF